MGTEVQVKEVRGEIFLALFAGVLSSGLLVIGAKMDSSISAVWIKSPEVPVRTNVCVPVGAVPLPAMVAMVEPGGVTGLFAKVVVKPVTEEAVRLTGVTYSLTEVRLTAATLLPLLQVLMAVGSTLILKSG